MKPLESKFALRLEILNEWTLLLLSYMLICFSGLIPNEDDRYKLGYAYTVASVANIGVHVVFLLSSTIYKSKLCCKRAIFKRKLKNKNEQPSPVTGATQLVE